jgi:hypothetical protein
MSKRPLPFLILSAITLICLTALISLFAPDQQLTINNLQLTPLYGFFALLFLFIFSTFTYLLKSKKHGILIAGFALIYLVFRLNDLTHPFFFILLAALFLTVELLVSYRK